MVIFAIISSFGFFGWLWAQYSKPALAEVEAAKRKIENAEAEAVSIKESAKEEAETLRISNDMAREELKQTQMEDQQAKENLKNLNAQAKTVKAQVQDATNELAKLTKEIAEAKSLRDVISGF